MAGRLGERVDPTISFENLSGSHDRAFVRGGQALEGIRRDRGLGVRRPSRNVGGIWVRILVEVAHFLALLILLLHIEGLL